jgi:anti-anti-sigma factor
VLGQALRPEGYEGAPLRAVETGRRRFRLLGELDLSNTEPLARFLAGMVAGAGDLTIDLRGLTFIDSAGVHLLIDCASALSGRGRLRLLEPRRSVARVIETTGLEWVPNLEVVGGDDAGGGHGTAVPVAPIDLSEPAGVSPPAGH